MSIQGCPFAAAGCPSGITAAHCQTYLMLAGDWHPSMYRSAPNMSAISLDWGDQGPVGQSEQNTAFTGNGNGLAATVMQERQASYMYIMPQEHLSSKDSPEVCVCVCECMAVHANCCRSFIQKRLNSGQGCMLHCRHNVQVDTVFPISAVCGTQYPVYICLPSSST